MGADIENPEADGCVAAAEPSRTFRTLKERLVASFLRNPNGAGGVDADDKAAKLPTGVRGGDADADIVAAKPAKRGWRYYVLHLCGAIAYLVFAASMYPLMSGDKDRLHIVLGSVGVIGGIISTLFLCAVAEDY
jgi:hypothetical protein